MLSISDEKINARAVSLEIVRNKIMLEVETKLNLTETPWQMSVLEKNLENLLIHKNFEEYKTRIVMKMCDQEVKDYKVELYMRHFIIEPLLQNNYLRILDIMKVKIKYDLINKFPITTIVLSEETQRILHLDLEGSPIELCMASMRSFTSHLNLTSTFDNMVDVIVGQVHYFELVASENPENIEKVKIMSKDNKYVMKVLEINCKFLIDICSEVFEAICTCYQLTKFKTESEIEKLRKDYSNYVRENTIKDKRALGSLSPRNVVGAIILESKRAWKEAKKRIIADAEKFVKNDIYLTSTKKITFKNEALMLFTIEVEAKFNKIFGFVPKADLFLKQCYHSVDNSIEKILQGYFSDMLTSLKTNCENLKFEMNMILGMMLKPETKYKYRSFPILPDYQPDSLLHEKLRKWLSVAAVVSTPHTFDEIEYAKLKEDAKSLVTTWEMKDDPDVKHLLEMTSSIESKKQNNRQIHILKSKAEQEVDVLVDEYDIKQIAYILIGIYFTATDGERDLLELRRAVSKNDLVTLKPLNYKKRKLVVQMARYLKNGRLNVLNYQIVLLLETLVEKMRHTHNRYIAARVIKSDLGKAYTVQYSSVFDNFKKMPVVEIAKLLKNESILDEVDSEARRVEDWFANSFVADVQFRVGRVKGTQGDVDVMLVDEDLTIEKNTEETILRRRFYDHSTASKEVFIRKDGKDSEELKVHGKLQYLKENMNKFEFIDLHANPMMRSRCPVLCLSGFMSEDRNHAEDWKDIVELYPFTEVLAINWEDFTMNSTVSAMWKSLKRISFKSLTNMIVNSLDKTLADLKVGKGDTLTDVPKNENKVLHVKIIQSMVVNSFEVADDDDASQEQDNDDDLEAKEITPRASPSLWKILKTNKIKDIQTRDTMTKAILNITKMQQEQKKPILSKALDDDDDFDPESNTNEVQQQPTFSKVESFPTDLKGPGTDVSEYLPAFTITTGVYDFYRQNPFTNAYHHTVLAGQLLALMIAKSNIFNANTTSLCGYSFGSVLAYSTCVTLFDLGCHDKVGDVCLMASCVDLTSLGQNIHKLIGTKGVVQGKLTVVFTIYDSVLAYIFRSARVAKEPIGLNKISRKYLVKCLKEQDDKLAKRSDEELDRYLSMKFKNVDASSYVEGHIDYMANITRIMQGIDFNSDLQHFKEKS